MESESFTKIMIVVGLISLVTVLNAVAVLLGQM